MTSAGRSFTAQWIERTSGKRVGVSIRKSASKRSPGAVTQHQHLAGVPALPHHEVPQVAGLRLLVVRLEALGPRPLLDGLPNRVAHVRREEALLDVDHLVPAARAVEAEDTRDPSSPDAKEYSSLLRYR